MAWFAYSEKQALSQSQRLAGRRFMENVLRIVAYVRQGKGKEKNWQREKKKRAAMDPRGRLDDPSEMGHEGWGTRAGPLYLHTDQCLDAEHPGKEWSP